MVFAFLTTQLSDSRLILPCLPSSLDCCQSLSQRSNDFKLLHALGHKLPQYNAKVHRGFSCAVWLLQFCIVFILTELRKRNSDPPTGRSELDAAL